MANKSTTGTVFMVLLAGGGFLCALAFIDIVASFGHAIPQSDMATDYILGCVWAMILGGSIFFWPLPEEERRRLRAAWLIRCMVTLGFMLLYENYYGLDSFGYFMLGRGDFVELPEFGRGGRNVTYLAYLHHLALPDSYHLMKVSWSMLGFLACYIIYRAIVRFTKKSDSYLFYMMTLFPSIIFWSSTLGKDPIVLFGIALYIYGVISYTQTPRLHHFFLIALGVFIAAGMRTWVAPILLAPLSVFMFFRLKGLFTKIILFVFVVVSFSMAVERFNKSFSIQTAEDLMAQTDAVAHQFAGQGGSGRIQTLSFQSPTDVVLFLPVGIFTALFRPLPGEVKNIFGTIAGIENMVLLFLLARGVFFRMRMSEMLKPVVIWAVLLVFVWGSVYGLVSYQNLGAAVRFKLQIMPVLLGLLLYINRRPGAVHSHG